MSSYAEWFMGLQVPLWTVIIIGSVLGATAHTIGAWMVARRKD